MPVVFVDDFEERIFQMPITGPDFDLDNRTFYQKLKAILVSTAGYACIKRYDKTENGRQDFKAWVDHYNGTAKSNLESLHYKNERSVSFERYTELLTKSFSTLDKDIDEKLSDIQKVDSLLKGIKTQDMELSASKAVIGQQYPRDLSAACAYFSKKWRYFTVTLSWKTSATIANVASQTLAGTVDVAEVKAAIAATHKSGDVGGGAIKEVVY